MGQRLAPVLAIVNMSKIEKPVLDRRPVLYCRYVDDCFVACSTQKEMDKCLELLNSQADNIQFTREKPNDKRLPFLNMQVQLERGFLRTKWYRKPTSKNILVHFGSAHPRKLKRAITANVIRTAKMVSSGGQEQVESVELAGKVALQWISPEGLALWQTTPTKTTRAKKLEFGEGAFLPSFRFGLRQSRRESGLAKVWA
nr:Hypothetical protein CBG20427 [Haemonchus contortus]